jgi:hypothetical protein
MQIGTFVTLVNIMIAIVVLLFVLAAFVALCVVQAHLSRRKSPWPGLILPIVSGVFILLFLLIGIGNMLFTENIVRGYAEGGAVQAQPNETVPPGVWETVPKEKQAEIVPEARVFDLEEQSAPMGSLAIIIFSLLFVPPLTFTVIYIACRVSLRKNPLAEPEPGGYASPVELKKMNIQDL